MDDARLGRAIRALRRRRGWRQRDLAEAAGVSQTTISQIERGHLDAVSLRMLRAVIAALDARLALEVRWRAGDLDRLVDRDHASLGSALVELLRPHGWQVMAEVTYAEYAERGSVDVLAFHPSSGCLLVIEIQTEIASGEQTLRKLDEKTRLAPTIARKRFGWGAASVSKLLVVADTSTNRRRIQETRPSSRRPSPRATSSSNAGSSGPRASWWAPSSSHLTLGVLLSKAVWAAPVFVSRNARPPRAE